MNYLDVLVNLALYVGLGLLPLVYNYYRVRKRYNHGMSDEASSSTVPSQGNLYPVVLIKLEPTNVKLSQAVKERPCYVLVVDEVTARSLRSLTDLVSEPLR